MQATKYKIGVYRGVMDFAHGVQETLEEIYVPKHLYINFVDEHANIFKGSAKRFRQGKDVELIEIRDRVVRDLERFVEQKDKINKIIRKLLPPKMKRKTAHSRKPEER